MNTPCFQHDSYHADCSDCADMSGEGEPMTEQPEPRFFIGHGMIHDRVTGKHVDPTPIEYEEGKFDTSPVDEVCALLNSLTRPSPEADALPVRAKELLATYLTGSNVAAASIALQLGGHARTMAEPFFALRDALGIVGYMTRDEALAALARTPAQEGE
jgi:hypothetical protein